MQISWTKSKPACGSDMTLVQVLHVLPVRLLALLQVCTPDKAFHKMKEREIERDREMDTGSSLTQMYMYGIHFNFGKV